MNTRIAYMYRDAANYKTSKEIVLEGEAAPDVFFASLHEREYFIPYDVGLPELQPSLCTVDDHIWHELERVVLTDDAPDAAFPFSAAELASRFHDRGAAGWDESAAFDRHRIF